MPGPYVPCILTINVYAHTPAYATFVSSLPSVLSPLPTSPLPPLHSRASHIAVVEATEAEDARGSGGAEGCITVHRRLGIQWKGPGAIHTPVQP